MEVTASSRVVNNSFEVTLERHDGSFYNADWRIEPFYGSWSGGVWQTDCGEYYDGKDKIPLFSYTKEGVGVLSHGGTILKIVINRAPSAFKLITNGFEKNYYAGEIEELWDKRSPVIVYSDYIAEKYSDETGYDYEGMDGFVFLMESDRVTSERYTLGKLLDSVGNIVAFFPGTYFQRIESTELEYMGGNCDMYAYPAYWGGGYIFSQATWVENVSDGVYYFSVEFGGDVFEQAVLLSNGFLSVQDVNPVYDIDWSKVFFDGCEPLSTSRWRD